MLGGFEFVISVTEFFRYAFGTLPPLADVNYSIFWGLLALITALLAESFLMKHPGATINTTICKNKAEVERQLRVGK